MNDRIEMISLNRIEPNPANRRVGGFDQTKLEQLAESIKSVGVQQPAIVRKVEGLIGVDYQLVAGERRWRASRIAGTDALPCIVRELDDITALKIQTIENLQRDDVHPLDESDGYSQLISQAGYTIYMLAADVGKSTSYIYQRLKLSSLTTAMRELFIERRITAGHAILIARLGLDQQTELLSELFDYDNDPISVRALDEYIHTHIMLDISKITWKLADAELVAEAGSCQECSKRTGTQPALFADVCNNGKKDYCMDRSCFTQKQSSIVALRREELAGQEILEVFDGYSIMSNNHPNNVLKYYEWNECKKSDTGAKKVLVVDGNQPGRVTYGTITKQNIYQQSPEDRAKAKKEMDALKAAEDLRIAKFSAVSEAVKNQNHIPVEALRVCLQKLWSRWGWTEYISQTEGWITKQKFPRDEGIKIINKMDEAQLTRLLLLLTMSDEVKCQPYCKADTTSIDALMKVYSVSVDENAGKEAKKKAKKKK